MNNSNKINLKRNIIRQKNSKKSVNDKTYKNSSKINKSKSEFYKKINIMSNSKNRSKSRKNNININSHKLSTINRPIKLVRNNELINHSNPMELTFGSSSYISNNMQTETNETDKDKDKISIKIKNKFQRKNSFIKPINLKNDFKDKNDLNIKSNKILKLNKKLFISPSWKIRTNHKIYKNSIYNKESKKNKEENSNKSSFVIINYNEKSVFIDKFKCNQNNIAGISSDKIMKNQKFNFQKRVKDKNLKNKFITFSRNNLLKNKKLNNKNNIDNDTNYEIKKINLKRYSLNDSSLYTHNLKYNNLNINNINRRNKDYKLNDLNKYIIKINKSVDKENGKFNLIIKRTIADKCIRKMPKSTPKLLLSHPSFKKMFL